MSASTALPANRTGRAATRHILATLAFLVPTFPLGWFWHLTIFDPYYKALEVYREDILVEFGIISMLIQGPVWSFVYSRAFAGETVVKGALKFMCLAIPFAWSYSVFVIGAKHHMTSPYDFMRIELAFVVVHYAIFAPILAFIYSRTEPSVLMGNTR